MTLSTLQWTERHAYRCVLGLPAVVSQNIKEADLRWSIRIIGAQQHLFVQSDQSKLFLVGRVEGLAIFIWEQQWGSSEVAFICLNEAGWLKWLWMPSFYNNGHRNSSRIYGIRVQDYRHAYKTTSMVIVVATVHCKKPQTLWLNENLKTV